MTAKIPPSSSKRDRRAAQLLLALSVTLLLTFTLLPQEGRRDTNLVPMSRTAAVARAVLESPQPSAHPAFRYFLVQVVGNILAFLPIGASLAVLLRRGGVGSTLLRALAAGTLLSLTIELVQLALPTRATDIDDLILNTFGTLLGALVGLAWAQRGSLRMGS